MSDLVDYRGVLKLSLVLCLEVKRDGLLVWWLVSILR